MATESGYALPSFPQNGMFGPPFIYLVLCSLSIATYLLPELVDKYRQFFSSSSHIGFLNVLKVWTYLKKELPCISHTSQWLEAAIFE